MTLRVKATLTKKDNASARTTTLTHKATYTKSSTTYNNNGVSAYFKLQGYNGSSWVDVKTIKKSKATMAKGTTSGTYSGSSTTTITHNASGAAPYSKYRTYLKFYNTGFSPSSASDYSDTVTMTNYGPVKYTITFNANGGTGAPAAQTKTHGTNLTLTTAKPTRDGYDFVCWNTNSAGTGTKYNPGGIYSANAAVTLYAIWEVANLDVKFYPEGGALGGSGTNFHAYATWDAENECYLFAANKTPCFTVNTGNFNSIPATWTKEGYTFMGWYDADDVQAYDANGQCVAGKYWNSSKVWIYAGTGIRFYAKWQEKTYKYYYISTKENVWNGDNPIYPPTPISYNDTKSYWSHFTVPSLEDLRAISSDVASVMPDRAHRQFVGWKVYTSIPSSATTAPLMTVGDGQVINENRNLYFVPIFEKDLMLKNTIPYIYTPNGWKQVIKTSIYMDRNEALGQSGSFKTMTPQIYTNEWE